MIKYLKTEIAPIVIESLLKRYMDMYKYSFPLSNRLKEYIKINYNLSINYIINEIVNNVRVKKIKPDMLEIYIKNSYIDNIRLNNLSKLIEYGNREISPQRYLSKLLVKSLNSVERNLGGL